MDFQAYSEIQINCGKFRAFYLKFLEVHTFSDEQGELVEVSISSD